MLISENASTKQAIRAAARRIRRGLDTAAISAAVCGHLDGFLRASGRWNVASFCAFRREIDPAGIAGAPYNIYLPRVTGERLSLHRAPCELIARRWGLREPAPGVPAVDPAAIPELVVLVPGLCFDRRGYRVGYGGGFYDRFLLELGLDAVTLGVSADALVAEKLPTDPWDVAVDLLVTESGLGPPSARRAGLVI